MTPEGTPRTVLITGGSSGIGRAVVHEFLKTGDHVVVLDQEKNSDPLPKEVTLVVGDVTRAEDNVRAVQTALDQHGSLDVFIGNAGIHDGGYGIQDLATTDLVDIVKRVFEVDVIGYLLGAKAAAKELIKSRGCMIFTLSDASFEVSGIGAGIGYSIAKHGGLGLVRHLAADLAPNVRVNAVAPGGTITSLKSAQAGNGTRSVFEDAEAVKKIIRDLNPLNIVLTPEQIAPLYSFLASENAIGMTGEVLRPDGGLSIR